MERIDCQLAEVLPFLKFDIDWWYIFALNYTEYRGNCTADLEVERHGH